MTAPTFATSQRLVVIGATGSGKTFLARRIFGAVPPPRLVIDPKDDPEATGSGYAVTFRDPTRLPDAPVVRFVPSDPLDRDIYDRLYATVWGSGRRWFTWLDEAENAAPASRGMPRAMGRLITQGRVRGLGHMALNQRPVGIDPRLIGNAEHVITFRMGYPADLDTMAQAFGVAPGELRRWLGSLPRYGFAWYDRLGGRLVLADTVRTSRGKHGSESLDHQDRGGGGVDPDRGQGPDPADPGAGAAGSLALRGRP